MRSLDSAGSRLIDEQGLRNLETAPFKIKFFQQDPLSEDSAYEWETLCAHIKADPSSRTGQGWSNLKHDAEALMEEGLTEMEDCVSSFLVGENAVLCSCSYLTDSYYTLIAKAEPIAEDVIEPKEKEEEQK